MINIEIDGKTIETEKGSMVIEAAHKAGIHIPHFCYHKKLSVAANCRMCLVEIEKAPKPLPACATPAAEGMKIFTHSELAVKAQEGIMEFLLINHPLDCPICDQGGECDLQDLAVGYGGSASRYSEDKRVVQHKDVGALISTEEMTRCIQCTRCVRFGQEVAGIMELGMAFRGENAEIMSFVNSTVDSELSGNMIDLCPVGALTSKPFRYTARSWELSRRKSVSPHDSLGSNLAMHVKSNKVMRALPVENEDINECWISDRDRYSYEGLNSPDRLSKPMIKQNGEWSEVDWQVALEYIANGLRQIKASESAEQIAALATPNSTLEELYLLQKLMRGIGSDNIDFRLRQSDFSVDGKQAGVPWLGMQVADISKLDRILIVGSFLRKDHPMLASRIRQAVKQGAQVSLIHSTDDDLLMNVANKNIVAPDALVETLSQVTQALEAVKSGGQAPGNEQQAAIAKSLLTGENVAVLLGNYAQQHPHAAQLQALAQQIAVLSNGKFGFIGEAANSVGGYLAQATPGSKGLNAGSMLSSPRKAYLLLNVEAELDTANPQQAVAALKAADLVVAMSAYKHNASDYADVLLPISPFTETSGTYVSTEGRVQSFKGAVKPLGEARPAWKVLRVLGNLLEMDGFDQDTSEAVRDEALKDIDVQAKLNNNISGIEVNAKSTNSGFQRVSEVPIYATDSVVRRSSPLQSTSDAAAPKTWMNSAELSKLGLQSGDMVKVSQNDGSATLAADVDDGLPAGVLRVAAGHPSTSALGEMFGAISVERA
ncbi:MAG: NADH-quinone oxidoreductase subunit NuoG [Gallionella sp.]